MTPETRKPILSRGGRSLAVAGGVLAIAGGLLAVAAGLFAAHPAPAAPVPTRTPGAATAAPPTVIASLAPASTPAPSLTPGLSPAPTTAPVAARTPLVRPIRYAAIGASDTVGIGTSDPARLNWTARVAAQLPPDTVYRRFARSGITLGEALNLEVPNAIGFHPTLVTVWLTVNDSLRGVPLSVYQKELKILFDQLTTQTDATVLILNTPDIANALQPTAPTATRMQVRAVAQQWNAAIAATAAPYGGRVLVVDLFAPSEEAAQHTDWISSDGFHPSAAGYQQIADITTAALRRAGLLP